MAEQLVFTLPGELVNKIMACAKETFGSHVEVFNQRVMPNVVRFGAVNDKTIEVLAARSPTGFTMRFPAENKLAQVCGDEACFLLRLLPMPAQKDEDVEFYRDVGKTIVTYKKSMVSFTSLDDFTTDVKPMIDKALENEKTFEIYLNRQLLMSMLKRIAKAMPSRYDQRIKLSFSGETGIVRMEPACGSSNGTEFLSFMMPMRGPKKREVHIHD